MDETNAELKQLMSTHQLTMRDVSELIEVSTDTVKGWRAAPRSTRYRRAPAMAVELLRVKLEVKSGNK